MSSHFLQSVREHMRAATAAHNPIAMELKPTLPSAINKACKWTLIVLFFAQISFNLANAQTAVPINTQETSMSATGSFEVSLTPQLEDDIDAGRLLIEKQYQGDMQGEGKGQMLSKRTAVEGSAGYVAIEHFTGKIGDLEGSFSLLHRGIMDRGDQSLEIVVIADSGTEDFAGISGSMQIEIDNGAHSYSFEYSVRQ